MRLTVRLFLEAIPLLLQPQADPSKSFPRDVCPLSRFLAMQLLHLCRLNPAKEFGIWAPGILAPVCHLAENSPNRFRSWAEAAHGRIREGSRLPPPDIVNFEEGLLAMHQQWWLVVYTRARVRLGWRGNLRGGRVRVANCQLSNTEQNLETKFNPNKKA